MKNIFYVLATCWIAMSQIYAQESNTLLLKVDVLHIDKNGLSTPIPVDAVYDFRGQYPYYQILKTDFNSSDFIQLKITQMPTTGFIYVFNVDSLNNIKILNKIACNRMLISEKNPIWIPNKDSGLSIDYPGNEKICIWYSINSQIEIVDNLILGMEYTMGSFMQRTVQQLGSRLYIPSDDWYFQAKSIELYKDNNLKKAIPTNACIPIVLSIGQQHASQKIVIPPKNIDTINPKPILKPTDTTIVKPVVKDSVVINNGKKGTKSKTDNNPPVNNTNQPTDTPTIGNNKKKTK